MVHAKIEYIDEKKGSIHSDLCPPDCDYKNITAEYRVILHQALDEWLDNSNGTGQFYIKGKMPFNDDIKAIFELIDKEKLNEASSKIEQVKQKYGTLPDIIRAESLIKFLTD